MSRRRRSKEIQPPYRDPLFMESLPARPVRITTEYIDPLERLRREKVGDTIVMFGSARILSRDQAMSHLHKLQKAKTKAPRREAIPSRPARREIGGRNVPLLRGGARAGAQDHFLGHVARRSSAALRDLLRRRPRNHGGGQPRRGRSRRKIHRPEHRAAARAAPQ